MKSKASILGIIAALFIVFSTLLKINHWPGGISLQFLSLGILFTIFVIINTIVNLKYPKYNVLLAVGGFSLALFIVGFIFKQLHWPYASLILTTSFFLLIAILFVLFSLDYGREDEKKKKYSFILILSIVLVTMVYQASFTGIAKNVIDGYTQSYINSNVTKESLLRLNENIINNKEEVSNEILEFHESTIKLLEEIEEIEKEVASAASDGIPIDDYTLILRKDNYDITTEILIIQNKATQIKNMLGEYRSEISKLDIDPSNEKQILILLQTRDVNDPDFGYKTWESLNFEFLPAISAIATLTAIQANILLAEFAV